VWICCCPKSSNFFFAFRSGGEVGGATIFLYMNTRDRSRTIDPSTSKTKPILHKSMNELWLLAKSSSGQDSLSKGRRGFINVPKCQPVQEARYEFISEIKSYHDFTLSVICFEETLRGYVARNCSVPYASLCHVGSF
jgi:hypothetical protein